MAVIKPRTSPPSFCRSRRVYIIQNVLSYILWVRLSRAQDNWNPIYLSARLRKVLAVYFDAPLSRGILSAIARVDATTIEPDNLSRYALQLNLDFWLTRWRSASMQIFKNWIIIYPHKIIRTLIWKIF